MSPVEIHEAGSDAASLVWRCLTASGMLAHRRRCYEDSRYVTLADMREALAQPALDDGMALIAAHGDDVLGFAVVSLGTAGEVREGRIHFFTVRPDADGSAGEPLLDRTLDWFERRQVDTIRQARLDPISGVFRVEQDREWIDLFERRGFDAGRVAGNLEIDVRNFCWTERLQSQSHAVCTHDIHLRSARLNDVAAIRALNASQGLALWDYHLDVMLAANTLELMQVAEQDGQIVGYANFFASRWDTALPEFGPLLVAADRRGLGLGSVLTARAMQFARANGKRRVRLSTLRFDFYRALGFEVTVTWHEQMRRDLFGKSGT